MITGIWTRSTVGWVLMASALPVMVELGFEQGAIGLGRFGLGLAIIAFWQVVFRITLGVPLSPATGIAALALSLLAPSEVGFSQFSLALSFGVVVGELIFGGWGRNFLSSGVVALTFLSLSIPNLNFLTAGPVTALAVVPGAIMLAISGILALPILLGFTLGLIIVSALVGISIEFANVGGSLAFVAVFLVADPVASATTTLGRWLHGLMAGALTSLLATGAAIPNAAIYAALIAALFTPLVDQIVLAAARYRRRSSHG